MGCLQKAVVLTPSEKHILKSFVQDGLGCGCPDAVFSAIQVQKNPSAFNGLPVEFLIAVGGRLLVGISLSGSLDNGINADIKKSLALGKQLRDSAGFNRFRLVVPSEDLGGIVADVQEQYNGISGLDNRIHLHAVNPSVIPKSLTSPKRL